MNSEKGTVLDKPLTPREKEYLALLGEELSNPQIAERLTVALSTVKWTLRQVFAKLGAQNRRDAVAIAREIGLLADPARLTRQRYQLLPEPNAFIGRAAELAILNELIAKPAVRLITVTGAGGMGKTRLALALAHQIVTNNHQFVDGVLFVPLAAIDSADSLIPVVAAALNLTLEGGRGNKTPEQQIINFLRRKQLLLILDNYEQLLPDIQLLTSFLRTAPDLQILVTSRERLQLQEEHCLPLAGLTYPDWKTAKAQTSERLDSFTAFELFTAVAQRLQPNYQLNTANIATLTQMCRLVEGMPLALELAAGWLDVLSLEEILIELQQNVGLLETKFRNVPTRHHHVFAAFESTWKRLTEQEQSIFAKLSLFRGGFTREAAHQVCATEMSLPAFLQVLSTLMNKSLLRHQPETDRYNLHELLRQFAANHLSQSPSKYGAACDRHSAYYCAALHERESEWKRGKEVAAFAAIELDFENFRVAWQWAAERGRFDWLDQATESMGEAYAWQARYQEGEAAFAEANSKLQARTSPSSEDIGESLRVQAKILIWQAEFNREFLGQRERAAQLLEQSQDLLQRAALAGHDTRKEEAWLLIQLSRIVRDEGDQEKDANLKAQSLQLFQELGDPEGIAYIIGANAWGAVRAANYDEAQQGFQQALAMWQTLGNTIWTTNLLGGLGLVALTQGRLEESERLLRESLALDLKRGRREKIINPYSFLSSTLQYRGKFDEAHAILVEGLDYCYETGRIELAIVLEEYQAEGKLHLGQYKQALIIGEKVYEYWNRINRSHNIAHALVLLGKLSLVAGEYSEAQRLLAESVAILRKFKKKGRLGHGLAFLGLAQQKVGQAFNARQSIIKSVQMVLEVRSFTLLISVLPLAAYVLARSGRILQAVELYALVSRYPFVSNSCWFADVIGKHIEALSASLSPEEVTAVKKHGQEQDLWETAEKVLATMWQ